MSYGQSLKPSTNPERLPLILGALLEQLGLKLEAERLRSLVSAADLPGDPLEALRDLGAVVGLRCTPWRGALADAIGLARPDLPLVLQGQGGELWLLVDQRAGRLVVNRPGQGVVRLSRAELAAALPEDGVEGLIVGLAAPGAAMLGAADLTPTGRLLALIRARGEELGVVILYGVGAGLLALASPLAAQVLINTVAFTALRQPIALIAVALLGALGLAALLRALQRLAVEHLQRRIFVKLVADLGWRLPRVRHEAWDKLHGPELINRFFDVLTVQKAASTLLLEGAGAIMQAVVGLLLLAVYHPLLLAFDLILLLAVALVLVLPYASAAKGAVYESKAKYAVAGWLEELASLPHFTKTPGGERLALLRADALARDYLVAREAHFKVAFRQVIAALAVQAVAATALLGVGGWLVIAGQLTLGQLVAAELIVNAALAGFTKLAEKLESYYDLLAALDKLGQLVNLPLERQDGLALELGTGPAALELRGAIYRFSDERPVLRGADLRIAPGERVAVLGGEGVGKGLVAEVFGGLRELEKGGMFVDEIPSGQLSPASMREVIGFASAPQLIPASILENVRLGRSEIDRASVEHALMLVGLLDSVRALPRGIDTELGPRGTPLSALRCRRLALARAIVGGPRVLVVDRLLDSFPPEDQLWLYTVLADPRQPWTLLLFTRDPRLAARCERTLALVDGWLVPAELDPDPIAPPGVAEA